MTKLNELSDRPLYPIKAVCSRTGVRPVTLRAWERRYSLLTPSRAGNHYRLYSEQDIAILAWAKAQVDEGLQISTVARLVEDKRRKGDWPELDLPHRTGALQLTEEPAEKFVPLLFQALYQKKEGQALAILNEVLTKYPLVDIFCGIISPVLVQIGEAWYEGRIGVSTEHFASSIIRGWLQQVFFSLPPALSKKRILIGAGPEEDHEIGELMFANLLREKRYLVDYVGPDNPLDELAEYAGEQKAALVILTATLDSNARQLKKAQEYLNRLANPPVFAFAGRAFNLFPVLIPSTPGVYLGKDLIDGLIKVEELIGKPG
jgi:MerR family transcriptional regulator, light-induced transcriptional regulator